MRLKILYKLLILLIFWNKQDVLQTWDQSMYTFLVLTATAQLLVQCKFPPWWDNKGLSYPIYSTELQCLTVSCREPFV